MKDPRRPSWIHKLQSEHFNFEYLKKKISSQNIKQIKTKQFIYIQNYGQCSSRKMSFIHSFFRCLPQMTVKYFKFHLTRRFIFIITLMIIAMNTLVQNKDEQLDCGLWMEWMALRNMCMANRANQIFFTLNEFLLHLYRILHFYAYSVSRVSNL